MVAILVSLKHCFQNTYILILIEMLILCIDTKYFDFHSNTNCTKLPQYNTWSFIKPPILTGE